MIDYPVLLEKLGADGFEELRRLIADELARRPILQPPLEPGRPSIPGPDEDIRPRG
jgi:DNA-binding MurR/RpiR family transcriptional regulator